MTNNTLSLRSLLEKEKLNGTNFLDWFRNLRMVLKQERKDFVIEEPILMNQLLMHLELTKTIVEIIDVECLMLTTMNPEL